MAQADLDRWLALAATNIPLIPGAGNTQITCNDSDATDADPCTRGSTVTILITWSEQSAAGFVPKPFSMDFQP